jgi:hypothetical protein
MAQYYGYMPQLITTTDTPFEAPCNGTLASDSNWYASLGAGMSASTGSSNALNMGYYTISSGTTANSESVLILKKAFQLGAQITFGVDRSINTGTTNQNFYIEVVEVDPAKVISDPANCVITQGTSAQVANARNCYQMRFQPSSSAILHYVRSYGDVLAQYPSGAWPALNTVQNRLGTSPNLIAGNLYRFNFTTKGLSLFCEGQGSNFTAGNAYSGLNTSPSSNTAAFTGEGVRLDPTKWYALRFRIVHSGTTPAASIDYNIYRPCIVPTTPSMIDVTSATERASNVMSGSNSLLNSSVLVRPVNTAGTALNVSVSNTVSVNATITSTSVNSSASNATALGSAGVYTSTGQTLSGAFNIVATAVSDVASATNGFEIQHAPTGGATWYTAVSGTLAANVATTLKWSGTSAANGILNQWRVRVTNGGTAQTVFAISAINTPALGIL